MLASLFIHFSCIDDLNVKYETIVNTLPFKRGTTECLINFSFFDVIMLSDRCFSRPKEKAKYIRKKLWVIFYLIRIIMVVSPITWYFFNNGVLNISFLIVFHVTVIFVANLCNILAQITWLIIFISIELPLVATCLCISVLCRSNRNNQNNDKNQQDNNAIVVQQVPAQNCEGVQNLFQNRPIVDNNIDQNNNENNNNQNNQEQVVSDNSFQTILKHGKRKYNTSDFENNPNCCVCLDNFKINEDIVELLCNPNNFGHIFQHNCIRDWSRKQKPCPLCRKGFNDIIKQNLNKRQPHNKMKVYPFNVKFKDSIII